MASDTTRTEISASPAGKQLSWYLDRVATAGECSSDADRERFKPEPGADRWMPAGDDVREWWARLAAMTGRFRLTDPEAKGKHEVAVTVEGESGKRWRLNCRVEEKAPHRIRELAWERQFDFEVTVREATEADAALLSEIERRCPIVLDDRTITFDRGDDYFAFARLMEDVTVGLGFVDGVPAAINCGAMRTVHIGGRDTPMMTAIHTRVLPEHQKKGLWGAVSRILGEKYGLGTIGSQGFVSMNNAAMQRGFANTPNRWPLQALRCQLSSHKLAGPPAGRRATPDDGGRIARLLNECHRGEELYLPYTEETLTARLERAPAQYSWDRVWLTDGAAVGVWSAGKSIRVIVEQGGNRKVSRRGLVLDYGFAEGAEEELEALLRAWCGWLAERGFDTLSVFTSERSPGYEMLRELASEVDAFDMWTPGIPVPADAEERGLYVDQVYF